MNGYLKQSTASQARLIGPFVDDTDFKTAETGLTIANTDIKLRANGTTLSNKNSGGGTHQVNGMYSVSWDATDTANVGELFFSVVVAGALQVFGSYWVLEEAVYDALFGASAAGYGAAQTGDSFARLGAPAGASVSDDVAAVKTETASIQSDTNDIQTRLPAALVSGRIDASVGAMAAGVVTAAAIATDAIDADALAADAVAEINAGAASPVDANIVQINGATGGVGALDRSTRTMVLGTVDTGSSTTNITTSSLSPAASVIDQFKGRIIIFDEDTTTAALRGQATDITGNTALGAFTVTALTTSPVSGDTFVIV